MKLPAFLIILMLTLGVFHARAQMYIMNEDFANTAGTTPPPEWQNTVNTGQPGALWHFDNPGNRTVNFPVTQPFAIFDAAMVSPDTTLETATLETPFFDASVGNYCLLLMDHFFFPDSAATATIFAYNGVTWLEVARFDSASASNPANEVIDLTATCAGRTDAKLRFQWMGHGKGFWAIDNVRIYAPLFLDAGISAIDSPVMPFASGLQEVKVTLRNFGYDSLRTVVIKYSVNGVLQQGINWNGRIPYGSELSEIAIGTYDFQPGVVNQIKVWSEMPNGTADGNRFNDSIAGYANAALCGTYTIGGIDPNFTSFSEAVMFLNNAGITCPVTFRIRNGTYNEQIEISSISGSSPANTVTFESESGDSSGVVLQFGENTGISNTILFINAHYVSFKKMTIMRSSGQNVLDLTTGTSNIEISNCQLFLYGSGDGSFINIQNALNNNIRVLNTRFTGNNWNTPIVFAPQGVSDFVFTNNILMDYGDGWRERIGISNATNVKIESNLIQNCTGQPIVVSSSNNLIIRNNRLIGNQYAGINVGSCNNARIEGNYLNNSKGIVCSNSMNSIIAGNRLLNVNNSIGIDINSSNVHVFNNYIFLKGDQVFYGLQLDNPLNSKIEFNSINCKNTNTRSAALKIRSASGMEMRNNIFANLSDGHSVIVDQNGINNEWNNNNYYAYSVNLAKINSANIGTINEWIAAIGQDSLSLSTNPFFTLDTIPDVHNILLNNSATSIQGIYYDIDSTMRDPEHPDVGAKEFMPCNIDVGINQVTSPQTPIIPGPDEVKVILQNQGKTVLTSATINWTVNGNLQSEYHWSGILASGENIEVIIGQYNFSSAVRYQIKAWTSLPNSIADCDPYNDTTMSRPFFSTLCGVYTIGGFNPNFTSFSEAVMFLNNAGITCPVTFKVRNGTYNEQIEISSISGSSPANTVTFESESGDSSGVVLQFGENTGISNTILFINAHYVSFKKMTIMRSSGQNVLDLTTGTSNIEISNCQLFLYGSGDGSFINIQNALNNNIRVLNTRFTGNNWNTPIVFAPQGVSDFVFTNNILMDYGDGWRERIGISNATNVKIESNLIQNCTGQPIVVSSSNNLIIRNNRLIGNQYAGINVGSCNNARIEGNYLNNSKGIVCSNSMNSIIAGNRLLNVNNSIGIDINSSNVHVFNNYIHSYSNNSLRAINIINCTNSTISYNTVRQLGINVGTKSLEITSCQNLFFFNNIFSNYTGGICILDNTLLNINYWDFNDYYCNINNIGSKNGVVHKTLISWAAAISGEANGKNLNPYFASDSSYQTYQRGFNGAGIPIPGVLFDIEGEIRNDQAPDIGCDEFTVDFGISQVLSPTASCSHTPDENLTVWLRQYGDVPFTNIRLARQINGGAIVYDSLMGTINNDIYFTFQEPVDISAQGEYTIKCWLVNNYDDNLANDTITVVRHSSISPVVDFISEGFCAGNPVSFMGTASVTYPYVITSYEWVFGDGDSAFVQNPVHVFAQAGNYPVSFRAYSDAGCYGETTNSLTIYPVLPSELQITAGKNPSCAGEPVTFTASFINPGSDPQWHWEVNGIETGEANQNQLTYIPSGGDQVRCILYRNLPCPANYPDTSNIIVMQVSPAINASDILAQDTVHACAESLLLQAAEGFISYNWNTGAVTREVTADHTSWYSCTVSNGGCTVSDSILVNLLSARILPENPMVCNGTPVTLSMENQGMYMYKQGEYRAGFYFDYDNYEGGPGSSDDWTERNGTDPQIVSGTAYSGNYSLYFSNGWGRNYEGGTVEAGQPSGGYYSAEYPFMSMAYKIPATSHTTMLVNIAGIGWRGIAFTQGEQMNCYGPKVASWNAEEPIVSDNQWHYKTINLHEQLQHNLGAGNYKIEAVIFYDACSTYPVSGEMWIDEFSITAYPPSYFPTYYQWSTGDTLASVIVAPAIPTTYYCTVSNGIGSCTDSVTVNTGILTPEPIEPDTVLYCGESYVIEAAEGFVSYQWNTGATAPQITVNQSGWYVCTVSNGSCMARDSVYVNLLPSTIIPEHPVSCNGNPATLSIENPASSLIKTGEYLSGVYYDYDNFEGGPGSSDDWTERNNGVDPQIVSNTAFSGSHSLWFSNGWGRNYEFGSIEPGQPANGYFSADYPYMSMAYKIPSNSHTTMLVHINGFGWRGIAFTQGEELSCYGPKVASWNEDIPLITDNQWHFKTINLHEQLQQNLGPGNYKIEALIFFDGCGAYGVSGEFWIDEFSITSAKPSLMPVSYLWSTGDTTTSITMNPDIPTTYSCTVSNSLHSCTDSVTVNVVSLSPDLFPQDTLMVCGQSYTLDAGGGYTGYLWNTGSTAQEVQLNRSGWYLCTVFNEGCQWTDSVFVSMNNIDIQPDTAVICLGESIALEAGGWENSYREDFNSETVPYWSNVKRITFNGNQLLGRYFDEATGLEICCLPSHDSVLIEFDFYAHDSWDNVEPFVFQLNGTTIATVYFSYMGSCSDPRFIKIAQLPTACGGWNTYKYRAVLKSAHSTSDFSFNISQTNGESACNESWSLDNFELWPGLSKLTWSTGDTTSTITVSPSQTTTYYCTITNSISSCTDSVTVYVTDEMTPELSGPESVCAGTSGAVYSTDPGMTDYQWTVSPGGIITAGGTAGSHTVTVTWNSPGGGYVTVNYTNPAGCPVLGPTQLDVSVNPRLPVSVSISASANPSCPGEPVTFTAIPVNGGSNPSYLWKKGNLYIPGSNNPTYTYVPSPGDAIACLVTSNAQCAANNPSLSNTIIMSVSNPVTVSVTIEASADTVCEGTLLSFTAIPVNGGTDPTWQWRKNGMDINGANGSAFEYYPADGDIITCIMSSSEICAVNNPAQSNAITLTVDPLVPVGITITPSANPVCEGTEVAFTAMPVNGGTQPLFQWRKNGADIPGAVNSYYSCVPTDGDLIDCILTSNATCATGSPVISNLITLTVIAPSPVTVTLAASANPLCEGEPATVNATVVNGGANPLYQWKKNGQDIIGETGFTLTYFPIQGDAITCLVTSNLPCATGNPALSDQIVFDIIQIPNDTIVCLNGSLFELSGASPAGGSYAGNGVLFGAYFDPATAGLGAHVITYTVTDQGYTSTCSFTITVIPPPEVVCPETATVCINAGIIVLDQGAPEGGLYEGPGAFLDLFNPLEAGLGDHLITYYYTAPDGCTGSCTFTLTVTDVPEAICPAGFSVCITDPAFTITGAQPEGGSYRINGIPGNVFDPEALGYGVHLVEYMYSIASGCQDVCEFHITVEPEPEVTILADPYLLCEDYQNQLPLPYPLTANVPAYTSLNWSTSGDGTFSNPGSLNTSYNFGPNDLSGGQVTFTLTVQTSGVCIGTVSDQLTVFLPSQLIEIPAGWSGISSNVIPQVPNIGVVAAPCIDQLIIQISIGGIYWPDQNVNTLGVWNAHAGYKVKYLAPCCLPLFGQAVPLPSTIHLNVGVNYLPVHTKVAVKLTEVFGADTNRIISVVDIGTLQIYSPSFGGLNTLVWLEPGVGYLAYMMQSANITYPANLKSSAPAGLPNREPFRGAHVAPWNEVINTGSYHLIAFENAALKDIETGDVIGVFNQHGLCAGFGTKTETDRLLIPVFGDDPYTQDIDGMAELEMLTFRLYRHQSGEVLDIEVNFDPIAPNSDGLFTGYGLSRVTGLKAESTSVHDQTGYDLSVYPNPADKTVTVQWSKGIRSVSLVNAFSQMVAEVQLQGEAQAEMDISRFPAGVYLLTVKDMAGLVRLKRLVVE